jgi:hypothetical protein
MVSALRFALTSIGTTTTCSKVLVDRGLAVRTALQQNRGNALRKMIKQRHALRTQEWDLAI